MTDRDYRPRPCCGTTTTEPHATGCAADDEEMSES